MVVCLCCYSMYFEHVVKILKILVLRHKVLVVNGNTLSFAALSFFVPRCYVDVKIIIVFIG